MTKHSAMYYVQNRDLYLKALDKGGEDAKLYIEDKMYSKDDVIKLLFLPNSFGFYGYEGNMRTKEAINIMKADIVAKEYFSGKEVVELINHFELAHAVEERAVHIPVKDMNCNKVVKDFIAHKFAYEGDSAPDFYHFSNKVHHLAELLDQDEVLVQSFDVDSPTDG